MHKKFLLFATCVFFASVICTCTLPSAVEVKAHPQMSVPAKVDFGSLFSESIEGSFNSDDTAQYTYTDTDIQTILLHVTSKAGNSGGGPLPSIRASAVKSESNSSPMDDFIEGFEFAGGGDGVQAWLYLSESSSTIPVNPISALKPTIYIRAYDNKTQQTLLEESCDFDSPNGPVANISKDGKTVQEADNGLKTLIKAGESISNPQKLLNAQGSDIRFEFKIIKINNMPNNGDQSLSNFPQLTVDILYKIPLNFAAKAGVTSPRIKFPKMGGAGNDLFQRKNNKDDSVVSMLQSLELKVQMSKPVFEKGTLYLNQADDDIYFSFPNFMTKDNGKNIMTLSFKPEDLELINKTFPFVPEIGVLFPNFGPADRFPIPNGLETQRLTFDAKIDYKSNLDDLFGGSK